MRSSVPALDALGQAHDRDVGADAGRGRSSTARYPCDGTAITTTSAPAHAAVEVGGRAQRRRERDAGEVARVLVPVADRVDQLGVAAPQRGRRVLAHDRGDGGAPRAGADDGHGRLRTPRSVAYVQRCSSTPPASTHRSASATRAGVVIPIRAFALGKARLADALDPRPRAALARRWAERGRPGGGAAARRRGVVRSPRCATGPRRSTSTVLADPGTLDARRRRRARPPPRPRAAPGSSIAHADLPRSPTISPRLARDGVAADGRARAVPPRRRHAGAVGARPTASSTSPTAPAPSAGTRPRPDGSASRVRVVRDRDLAFDVDVPDDLVDLAGELEATPTP